MMRLKELRNEIGLSQAAVAEQLGITQQAYANYEREVRQPDLEMLLKLSSFFNVSVDFLLGKNDGAGIDEELQGVDFALYGETKDLTEDEKQDILSYIRFKKSQRGEKN